ncbi:GFA family protein [Sphingomonas sp.]|uniref:GFA family protein n=1 Tax=Sphingomonas sp. TaxID=28214 RepID=UPI003B003957
MIAEGGCQCGRVRYAADVGDADAYLCHCRMCRKATGGASIAFVSVARAGVAFAIEPDWYRSSPIAHRPFCAACGTPLGFAFLEGAERMDLTLGSFDEPDRFAPTHHYATESLLPAWQDTAHLPGTRSEENERVVERWMNALGKLPD